MPSVLLIRNQFAFCTHKSVCQSSSLINGMFVRPLVEEKTRCSTCNLYGEGGRCLSRGGFKREGWSDDSNTFLRGLALPLQAPSRDVSCPFTDKLHVCMFVVCPGAEHQPAFKEDVPSVAAAFFSRPSTLLLKDTLHIVAAKSKVTSTTIGNVGDACHCLHVCIMLCSFPQSIIHCVTCTCRERINELNSCSK